MRGHTRVFLQVQHNVVSEFQGAPLNQAGFPG